MTLPAVVTRALADPIYRRQDVEVVRNALSELGTPVPADFREFYETYVGAFGSKRTGFELRELCEDPVSIVSDTRAAREVHHWPERFLVLSDLLGNAVLVLDGPTGRVFDVDFEGSDQELLAGTLEPYWPSFTEFLAFYFSEPG